MVRVHLVLVELMLGSIVTSGSTQPYRSIAPSLFVARVQGMICMLITCVHMSFSCMVKTTRNNFFKHTKKC